jgi:cytidine deaminase
MLRMPRPVEGDDTREDDDALLAAAREVLVRAWSPYSGFRVGAALQAEDGTVYTGCNVENASLGLTICAERTAAVKAVSLGQTRFVAIAVVTEADGPLQPCGACRQFLAEFAPDLRVLTAGRAGAHEETRLSVLLPGAFRGSELGATRDRDSGQHQG